MAAAPVPALGGVRFCAGQLEEEHPSQPRTERTGAGNGQGQGGGMAGSTSCPRERAGAAGVPRAWGQPECRQVQVPPARAGAASGWHDTEATRRGLRNEEARHRQQVTDSFLACLLGWRRARDRGAQ